MDTNLIMKAATDIVLVGIIVYVAIIGIKVSGKLNNIQNLINKVAKQKQNKNDNN